MKDKPNIEFSFLTAERVADDERMGCIFKILTASQWAAMGARQVFGGSPADLWDGYIHFSTAAQTPGTLAKYYAGQADLVLLAVDPDALPAAALRWEAARGGDLFPHLYAPLRIEAVRASGRIGMDAQGRHAPPEDVLAWA